MASEKQRQQAYAPISPPEQPPAYPGHSAGVAYGPPPPGEFSHIGQAMPPGHHPGMPVLAQPAPGQQVIIVHQNMFRDVPVSTMCPYCSQYIITSTRFETGGMAWLLCFLLAVFGLWLGCCLIPFCVDSCQDVHHSCPNCKKTIHVFRRM